MILCLLLFCVLYILNFGFGAIELVPDNIPIIGNFDEAGIIMMLVNCLKYFGIDLTNFFERKPSAKKTEQIEQKEEI